MNLSHCLGLSPPYRADGTAFHYCIRFRTGSKRFKPLPYWICMVEPCPICEGALLRIVQENGRQVAVPCSCQLERRSAQRLERAHIPRRYEHCSLESYDTHFPSANHTLTAAHLRARRFVEGYPVETNGTGLLLTGSIGVGKTHLAVGILQALVTERGATGLFYDYRDLLKQVQNSYNKANSSTEMDILRPVFEAEVLVLDELGANKPTDWVWDTVAHILNTRYNDRRTTIITTNYPNLAPLGNSEPGPRSVARGDARRPHRRAHALTPAGDVCRRRDAGAGLPSEGQARQLRLVRER